MILKIMFWNYNIFERRKRFCFLFKEVVVGGETVNNISDSLLSGRDYLLNKLGFGY